MIIELAALFFLQNNEKIFSITLEKYSSPMRNRTEYVEIYRTQNGTFISINDSSRQAIFAKRIDEDLYLRSMININKYSPMSIKSSPPANCANGYYQITIQKGDKTNRFSAEADAPLFGKNEKIAEIIRTIRNTADFIRNDR